MIRINLLPREVRVTESKINPVAVSMGVLVVLIMILTPISWSQFTKRSHLQAQVTSLNSELQRYKPIIAQVEALEQAKDQLQKRKGIIQQLENERLRYPQFMEDLLKLLPGNVWLTNLTTSQAPDGMTMTVGMDAIALDNYAIADLISNLETSQIFAEVDLGSISLQGSASSGQTLTFHVNTTYKKTEPTINASKKS